MAEKVHYEILEEIQKNYPEKFEQESRIFKHIKRGDRIFISTACGEPQYLVNSMVRYIESNPSAFADAEVMHVWTLGLAPYANEKFNYNFRHNSFFVGNSTRENVNSGLADYTPIFLSRIPNQFYQRMVPIDVALIQTSMPDRNGYVSLGVSVDITKAAIESAKVIIAQVNVNMPRVHGDTFIHVRDIDFVVHHDEKILEFVPSASDEIADKIGKYAARIVKDGDTVQIGYGSIPRAILSNMADKNDLGIHSELLTDTMVRMIDKGIFNNRKKTLNRGKTVASFCMGTEETYRYIDDNPAFEFKRIDYTNDPLVIAQQDNMTSINSALQIDLTGQATAESIGRVFYSGIGGSADFMRGAVLARGGKTILVMQSTALNGEVSRIVPFLDMGAGVTYNRGDIFYVVTEYGMAYIHGKNIRERAMDLIAIAHPRFRSWLIEEGKRLNLIYKDQAFIPGKKGEYPAHLESYRTTRTGVTIKLRPVNINDETLIKDFFYSLSDESFRRRFMIMRKDMPHEVRQDFVVIDYTKELIILACIESEQREEVVGMGQILKDENTNTAEVAFSVSDDYQNKGIGSELLAYLTVLGKREGLHGFTAEVLLENRPMFHVFQKHFPNLHRQIEDGVYYLIMNFGDANVE